MEVGRVGGHPKKRLRRQAVNKTIKNTKDVLRRMEEILNDTETGEANKTTKPNVLEILKSKTGLNRIRNER